MKPLSRVLSLAIFVTFGILATLSIIYFISRTVSASGATDFHSYWYAGHFIRQGLDPYTAFIKNIHPRLPIMYIDGHVVTELPVAQPGLARVPANTPLMVEMLSIFSLLSWPAAKFLWMFCNFLIVLAIPFLAIQLFPKLRSLPLKNKVLFVLIFLSLFGTRNTIGNGQTGALVFATMLLAISTNKDWLGGIALGIALSKYSLSLSAVILLMLEKRYCKIVGGLLLQVLGLLLLGFITSEPLGNILKAYLVIAQSHLGQPGVHIAATFSRGWSGWLLTFLLSAVVIGAIYFYLSKAKYSPSLLARPLLRPIMFNILMLWILLVTYHRAYDTLVTITFISLGAELLLTANNLSRTRQGALAIAMGGIVVALLLPAKGAERIIPEIAFLFTATWSRLHNLVVTLSLLSALLISIWALYHPDPGRINEGS